MDAQYSEAASLALVLAGFSSPSTAGAAACSMLDNKQVPPRISKPTAPVSAGPLVHHLVQISEALVAEIERGRDSNQLATLADKCRSMCFAVGSTVGPGQMEASEETQLWSVCCDLWDASLRCCSDLALAGCADVLHDLGTEVFALIDGSGSEGQDVSGHIAFLCKAGRTWGQLGRAERAAWCVQKAVRCAEKLEAMMAAGELDPGLRERCVLQLFTLFLDAAKSAAASNHKSVANNLLARAMQLCRHEAVGPGATATMFTALAGLQLEQGKAMLEAEQPDAAVALLSASRKQLEGAAARAGGADAAAQERLAAALGEVLLVLGEANLGAGQAAAAAECAEKVLLSGAAAWQSQLPAFRLLLRARLAGGEPLQAVRLLQDMLEEMGDAAKGAAAQDEAEQERSEAAVTAWLGSLAQALPLLPASVAPAMRSVVETFLSVTAGSCTHLLRLVEVLLTADKSPAGHGGDGANGDWQRQLALQLLAADATIAAVFKEPDAQQRCHALLSRAAAQRFLDRRFWAAAGLFAAAFQYAPASARGAAARALAACHLPQGQPQRACEYLVVAERAEEQTHALAQLLRLKAAVGLGDAPAAVAAIQGLEKCADFHASHIQCACALASEGDQAAPLREALALAVRVHIPAGGGRLGGGETGLDAELLLALATASLECAAQDSSTSPQSTFDGLVTTMRTATRQLRALGAQRFAGSAACLRALADAGHAACARALLAGCHEQCVTLATSTCVLADEYQALAGGADAEAGRLVPRVKAAVLAAAVEALARIAHGASVDGATTSRASALALASKLLQKLKQSVDAAVAAPAEGGGPEDAAIWRMMHASLALEVAALQGSARGMLAALEALAALTPALAPDQQRQLVAAVLRCNDASVHRAAAEIILRRARSGVELALCVLPTLLEMDLEPAQLLELCQAGATAAAAAPAKAEMPGFCGWLAIKAFNLAVVLARCSPGCARELLQVASAVCVSEPATPLAERITVAAGLIASWEEPKAPPLMEAAEAAVEMVTLQEPQVEAEVVEAQAEPPACEERALSDEHLQQKETDSSGEMAMAEDAQVDASIEQLSNESREAEAKEERSKQSSPPSEENSLGAMPQPAEHSPAVPKLPARAASPAAAAPAALVKRQAGAPSPPRPPAKRACTPPPTMAPPASNHVAAPELKPPPPAVALPGPRAPLRLRLAAPAAGAEGGAQHGSGQPGEGASSWLSSMFEAQRRAGAQGGRPQQRTFAAPRRTGNGGSAAQAPAPAAPILDCADVLSVDSL